MGKTLLQSFTGNTEGNENTVTVASGEDKTLSELMQDMKSHLDSASKDLLQPRAEALEKLIKKVLH